MNVLTILTNLVAPNLGMSFENIVLVVFLLGGCIFYAKDFLLGVLMHFIGSGGLFMLFWALEMNYVFSLVIFLISLVVMALSLYATSKVAQRGGII